MGVDRLEVIKVDLLPSLELNLAEYLEVDQLELFKGYQGRLLEVKHLLASIINGRLREAHHGSAENLCTLCGD